MIEYLSGRSKRTWTLEKVSRNMSVDDRLPIPIAGSKLELLRDGKYNLIEKFQGSSKASSGKWQLAPHPKSKSVWVLSLGTLRYASFPSSTPNAPRDELILVSPIEQEKSQEYREFYWNSRRETGKSKGRSL